MKIWLKQSKESAKAYAAFKIYLNLPPTSRSLDKAYHVYVSSKGGGQQKGKAKKVPGRWTEWSTKHSWVDRAFAYDTHNARVAAVQAARKRQAEIQKFVDADFNVSAGVQNITTKKLALMIRQPPEAVDTGELRQLCLAYDVSRNWLKELIGFLDPELDRLTDAALAEAEGIPPEDLS